MIESILTRGIEILFIAAAVYWILKFLRGTVGGGILIGLAWILAVLVAGAVATHQMGLEFEVLPSLGLWILSLSAFALLVIFQAELRRGLVRLGRNPWQELFARSEGQVVEEVVGAVEGLSKGKIGVLIALEKEVGLRNYIESSKGVKVDAEVTAQLLKTLFWPNTALHDGAVVIQKRRVSAAGCFFPLSDNPRLPVDFGSRHRAALGLSEETDAVLVVSSEETGCISVMHNGQFERNLTPDLLRESLRRLYVRDTRRGTRAKPVESIPHTGPAA